MPATTEKSVDSETAKDAPPERDSGSTGTGDGGPPGGDSRRPRRINVAVTPDVVEAIELIMKKEDISLTEAVRRLITYGEFVYRAIREDESEVLIRKGDRTKEIVLLA